MRFADDDDKPIAASRKRRQLGENASMTYLVEAAEDEIIDLAEPDALARHLTVASSASLAKNALRQEALAPAIKRSRLASLSAVTMFPRTADGKLIITDTPSGKSSSCTVVYRHRMQ